MEVQSFSLNDGTKIPSVGMGCWMGAVGGGQRVYDMCLKALKNGYRHFDTASGYGNEEQVGAAIRDSGVPRGEIYLTTKLANADHHRVSDAFEESLRLLNCEYIDLYLMHWPQAANCQSAPGNSAATSVRSPDEKPTFIETWKEMEKLLETGRVRTLGVSNFSIKTLNELLPHCSIIPATNQVEMHPCLPQDDLKSYCEEQGIILTAYSPLGRSATLFEEAVVNKISSRLHVTPAQVLLSWGVQRKTVVIPKSENDERMKDNLALVKLPEQDVQALNQIHLQPGMHRSLLKYHTPEGTVLGWTYEWLGWNMTTGGIVVTN
ncbi:NADP-dependent oxidoreductase domain-containing protein [Infundibulicybe gibba]|nr:NADP-dependent oxidoreductase domain-containing protein [Infundibulicybe gibba]